MADKMPDRIFDSVFKQLPKSTQTLMEFVFQRGQDTTWKDISGFVSKYSTEEESSTILETVDQQKAFLLKDMVESGQDKEEAQILIDAWEEAEKLKEKSESRLAKRVKTKEDKAKDEVKTVADKRKARLKAKEEFTERIQTTVEEFKYSPAVKSKVLKSIFKGDVNKISKKIHQHPKAFIQLANYIRLL